MILVTVGTQIPFDRLIRQVDDWALKTKTPQKIVAQIGASNLTSKNISIFQSVEPEVFEKYIEECDFIVSHAGMGSILTALRIKKPIIIFPRKASLGEHRNDHQLATARSFKDTSGVYVAFDEEQLLAFLDNPNELDSGVLTDSPEYKKLLMKLESVLQ